MNGCISLLSKVPTAGIFAHKRTVPALLITIMCLSLVSVQINGLHLHVGTASESGSFHGMHLHNAVLGEHGHDNDAGVEITPFDVGTVSPKLILFHVGWQDGLAASCRSFFLSRPSPLATTSAHTSQTFLLIHPSMVL